MKRVNLYEAGGVVDGHEGIPPASAQTESNSYLIAYIAALNDRVRRLESRAGLRPKESEVRQEASHGSVRRYGRVEVEWIGNDHLAASDHHSQDLSTKQAVADASGEEPHQPFDEAPKVFGGHSSKHETDAGPTATASDDQDRGLWTLDNVMCELAAFIDELEPGESFDVLDWYPEDDAMFWALVPIAIGNLFRDWQPVPGRDERRRYTVDLSVGEGLRYCDVICQLPGLGGALVRSEACR